MEATNKLEEKVAQRLFWTAFPAGDWSQAVSQQHFRNLANQLIPIIQKESATKIEKAKERGLEAGKVLGRKGIKNKLEKFVVHEDENGKVELLDVVVGKDWDKFWEDIKSGD